MKSSLVVRQKELSKLVLFVSCWRSSEEMPEDAQSTRGVPRQQTSAETVGGEVANGARVASVRSTETVVELGEYKARWFCGRRGVELAKCRFSQDCEECRAAASGDEMSRPHGKECRGASE